MVKAVPLDEEQRGRLAAAIRAAEARSTGDIFCVVARASDGYFYPAAFMLAVGMLVASTAAAFWLDRSWLQLSLPAFVAAQTLALAAGLALLGLFPALRVRFTPASVQARRAHANAIRQFLAHNIHRTSTRTGILIFVSLAERQAEIVADAGIDAKVDRDTWGGLVALLIARIRAGDLEGGLDEAIDAAGALLAQHFPATGEQPNELPDHVVLI